ncbi:MAG: hypothetical protein OXP71_18360 [Candidatus Poribacteria bacterium]|nr:hypothetical protein [Candidatus Poribacteria bacterium]
MKFRTKIKILIACVGILTAGFIGLQVLKYHASEVERRVEIVLPEARRITKSRFVKRSSRAATQTQQVEENTDFQETETAHIPEKVPTAQSSDDEIKDFIAWLSSLEPEDTFDETEQADFSQENNAREDEFDYDRYKSQIESVIWEQWKFGLEIHDIEQYMSAIWEDDFFYTSDLGTPDNPDDDLIFRGGGQEREGTSRMFNAMESIDLNLSQRGNIEFLNETLAMVEYEYDLTFVQHASGEVSYPSGHMFFILELRENAENTSEWRILEWYDYATPYP